MNGEGCYCIARYGGGGMYGMSKVDNIMLKFRPIAPKPVPAGSGSCSTTGNSDEYVKCGRSKRKYVRVNKNKKKKDNDNNYKKSKAASSSPPAVTLPLLPETPDRKENEPAVTGSFSDLSSPVQTTESYYYYNNNNNNNNNKKLAPALEPAPVWLSFNKQEQIPPPRPQVVSKVTVECVTDTWVDSDGLGCTDEERVMNMEKDTCPGFISDGQDRVVWANKAYRQMAGIVGHVVDGEDMAVVLVRKDKLSPSPSPSAEVTYPAFTCKVRVTSAANSQRQSLSPSSPTLILPCDVWRMERGACAWRLDVKAALSLGR